MSRSKAAV
ncbi:unnamed protein product, partial [Adineta steineri]